MSKQRSKKTAVSALSTTEISGTLDFLENTIF